MEREAEKNDEKKEEEEGNEEAQNEETKKLPYPKAVAFIIGNEFCERFSFYGMKGILSIYLNKKLNFDEDTSTVIYHTFSLFCYFTPVFGAMLADQVLGKFKTIMYISLIYILGHLLKTLAAVPTLGVPPVEFSLIGLALIALGTGGIKPCVSAFGGDQFKLPDQERQLQTFFSIFYFAINTGALISGFVTPILRQDVHCFGDDTCYSLAFGVPALLMLLATIILFVGKPLYVMKAPQGNILTKVAGSIWYGLKNKIANVLKQRESKHDHWMDHSMEVYPKNLVDDVKLLLKVLFIYLPVPIFWALFDQQGSRWTFQASRMNGELGSFYVIKPDQMHVINPVLILVLLPIFDAAIYPLCAKCNFLVKPLQRMTVGGLLAAASFLISGFLELELMKTYDHVPKSNESHLHLMNSLSCPLSARVSSVGGTFNELKELDAHLNGILYNLRPGFYDVAVSVKEGCKAVSNHTGFLRFEAQDKSVTGIIVRADSKLGLHISELKGFEEPKKSSNGQSIIRIIFDAGDSGNHTLTFKPFGSEVGAINITTAFSHEDLLQTNYIKIPPSKYKIYSGDAKVGNLTVGQGGVRTLFIPRPSSLASSNQSQLHMDDLDDFVLTTENSIHMLWLIPQYVVITVGEVMFSVTGLEFSYSQAPKSMKSVLQACWLWTVAFGNLIVIIVAEVKAFDDQASEFFMFSGLMVADMAIFAVMAYFYKYVDVAKLEREREEDDDQATERLKLEEKRNGVKHADNDAYAGSTDF